MELIFSVIQVAISIVLIFLVLMHSGKDAGLSGAFGVGTGQGPLGGGSLVERNLNRWTVGFAIAFALNTILLLKAPRGCRRRRSGRRDGPAGDAKAAGAQRRAHDAAGEPAPVE